MGDEFAGRRVVVMGLGRFGGGVGAARWLARQGAHVIVTDRADPATLADSIRQLDGLGIEVRCGRHDPADLDHADLLVVSPAVDKRQSEFVALARQRAIPITTEMNLFFERCRGRIVGVTGTVGKSTTCAMIYQTLRFARRHGDLGPSGVWLGGNIGRSLLAELDGIEADDLVVLELSSFQLEDLAVLRRSPAVAVITNLFPKHLDRHGSFHEYVECKLNICRYQQSGDHVFIGPHDCASRGVQHSGLRTQDSGLRTQDSGLRTLLVPILGQTGARLIVVDDDGDLRLKVLGAHNRHNAAVAARVAGSLGVARETVIEALAEFAGLPHRLQFVRRVDAVDYYNDSKATAPDALAAALDAFDRPVILIAGGQNHAGSWDVVRERRGRIKHAVCIGETSTSLAAVLEGSVAPTLEAAVRLAAERAEAGDVVLLSPGAPSFDQFVNYEVRGRTFVRAVEALPAAGSTAVP